MRTTRVPTRRAIRQSAGALAVAAIAAAALVGCSSSTEAGGDSPPENGTIFFLNPGQTSARWEQFDGPLFEEAFAERGYDFKMLDGGMDPTKQQSQAESAVAQGAVGIILTAADAAQAVGVAAVAQTADIPVVAYIHDVVDMPEDAVVAYIGSHLTDTNEPYRDSMLTQVEAKGSTPEDPFKMALVWGNSSPVADIVDQLWQDLIREQIDDGTIEIVCRDFAADYTAASAQQVTEQCLTRTSNDIDGVSILTDEQASGVFAALTDQGLTDDVKIYGGYDASLEGVQRVLAGYQLLTSYPDYHAAVEAAVDVMIAAIEGEESPELLETAYKDGAEVSLDEPGAIPAVYIHNVVVTKDNVQETIIDPGIFYTKEEICTGIAASSEFCTEG